MAPTPLIRAVRAHQKAKVIEESARERLHAAIADAARSGVLQREIVEVTGYSREQVRRICRAGGVGQRGSA